MKKWILFMLLVLTCACFGTGCGNAGAEKCDAEEITELEPHPTEEISEEKQTQIKTITVEEAAEEAEEQKPPAIKGEYSGWICGLVSNAEDDRNSDVLLINPETKEVKTLTTLKEVYWIQTCAVSPDGKKVAYTTWADEEDSSKGVCIMVKDLEKDVPEPFFRINGCIPQIEYLSWMPDNKTLLCNISLWREPSYADVICLLDTQTEEMKVLDRGKVWRGNTPIDVDKGIKIPELGQKELDELIDKYGGNIHIPVEENGCYNDVEIGRPILSPGQTKVMYVTNFSRDRVAYQHGEEPPMLCLASGIFVADISGEEEPQLIYGNHVERSCIGNAVWGRNDHEILFDRYYNEMSKNISDLVLYNLETKEEKVLIKTSKQMETQKPCFRIGENEIGIYSYGEAGEGFCYYDLLTDTYERESITYNGNEVSMWRFCEIY